MECPVPLMASVMSLLKLCVCFWRHADAALSTGLIQPNIFLSTKTLLLVVACAVKVKLTLMLSSVTWWESAGQNHYFFVSTPGSLQLVYLWPLETFYFSWSYRSRTQQCGFSRNIGLVAALFGYGTHFTKYASVFILCHRCRRFAWCSHFSKGWLGP
jgi:hypothetical protein